MKSILKLVTGWKYSLYIKRLKKSLKESTVVTKSQPLASSLEFSEREFYVIFTDTDKHIFSFWLKKGFRHCYVIEKLEYIYMMIDPTRHGLNIALPTCGSEHPLIENMIELAPDITVLKILTSGEGTPAVLRPKLMTCVSLVQYILGVSFSFCITPFSLYNKLKAGKHLNIISSEEICYVDRTSRSKKKQAVSENVG